MPTPPRALTTPTAHTTPPWPRHYPHLVAFFECLESIERLPMRAHTPPRPHHPPPGSHLLGVERVFKGCQCVPTPPRALTTPTARTPPGPHFLATTHTWSCFLVTGKAKPTAPDYGVLLRNYIGILFIETYPWHYLAWNPEP